MDNPPFFSICIPTYSRGKKALSLVHELLETISNEWHVMVLNNGSNYETEQYDEIERMAEQESRLTYFRHPKNVEFHGNFLSCFEQGIADYIMVLSDEDHVNIPVVELLLKKVKAEPNIGLVRGSITLEEGYDGPATNCITYPNNHFSSGKEALYGFSFNNNYPSGTIYHRKMIEEEGLLQRLRDNINSQQTYPHLYMDLLISSIRDVVTTSEVSCFEGAPQSQDIHKNLDRTWINYVYSYGERINQFLVLRNALFEAVGMVEEPFNVDLFILMYLKLCEKYYYLISRVNLQEFVSNYTLHPFFAQKAFYEMCRSAIGLYSEYENLVPLVMQQLDEMHVKWEQLLQEDINRMTTNS